MYEAFISGFSTFVKTFAYTFFSYVDIELVAVVAVESAQDLAIKATFLRIILFRILAILMITLRESPPEKVFSTIFSM